MEGLSCPFLLCSVFLGGRLAFCCEEQSLAWKAGREGMLEAARFSSAKGLAWSTWGWMEEFSLAVPLSQLLLSSVPYPWASPSS